MLRALLKQAGKQFVPDNSVAGQVTLLLTDQPLDTVLQAVCDASFLRYTKSPAGIYRFMRDDMAVTRAFNSLAALNSQLRGQLRALGLDVPSDESLTFGTTRSRGAGALGGAGRGARDFANGDLAKDQPLSTGPGGGANRPSQVPEAPAGLASKSSLASPAASAKKEVGAGNTEIHAYLIPQGEVNSTFGRGLRGEANGQLNLRSITQQNGFVSFNIPEEKPQPVTSVLQLFSQQSNIPILVDQSIPNGLKFRVWGNLSPRQLPEALNVLAPTAHLQWRWIGGSVFVVPAPSFVVSYGDAAGFRNQYPAPAKPDENSQTESRGRKSGSD